jgi:hypothetical protein
MGRHILYARLAPYRFSGRGNRPAIETGYRDKHNNNNKYKYLTKVDGGDDEAHIFQKLEAVLQGTT